MEVAVYQLDGCLIAAHSMNKGRDFLEPCLLCRPEPPVAGDDLILRCGALQRADDQRRENALLLNALDEAIHFVVVLHLVGVTCKGVQALNGNVDCLHVVSPLFCSH